MVIGWSGMVDVAMQEMATTCMGLRRLKCPAVKDEGAVWSESLSIEKEP